MAPDPTATKPNIHAKMRLRVFHPTIFLSPSRRNSPDEIRRTTLEDDNRLDSLLLPPRGLVSGELSEDIMVADVFVGVMVESKGDGWDDDDDDDLLGDNPRRLCLCWEERRRSEIPKGEKRGGSSNKSVSDNRFLRLLRIDLRSDVEELGVTKVFVVRLLEAKAEDSCNGRAM